MAKIGLNKIEEDILLGSLALSERFHAKAEQISPQRKAYSQIIARMSKRVDKALKEKNYIMLFDLEKTAQKHDAEYHAVSQEKTLQTFAALNELRNKFLECSDPEHVKGRFLPSMQELKMEGTRMHDKAFDATAHSICGFINSFKSPRCVPAENFYYSKRVECLKAIQKEHQRHIDMVLGHDTEKDKGLSR